MRALVTGGAGFVATVAAGFTSAAGGAAGRGGIAGDAAGCCFPMIAFSTSPGFEICERSIFVLNSSESGRTPRAALEADWLSIAARKCARTFSASCSSRELEWVFFSVTPTTGNESRIALLLTSSSLARSLIRILLIRFYVPPECPLSLHINLTDSVATNTMSDHPPPTFLVQPIRIQPPALNRLSIQQLLLG